MKTFFILTALLISFSPFVLNESAGEQLVDFAGSVIDTGSDLAGSVSELASDVAGDVIDAGSDAVEAYNEATEKANDGAESRLQLFSTSVLAYLFV